MVLNLTQIKIGEIGVIREIHGGHCFARRVQGMGIRPGKKIKKIASHFWCGPQTIEIDKLRFALGFGMAKKIFVEVER